uniref:Uncharacterized protein n=1 Tax=Leersia perrieri TaxID=77586 RepID=A0A0D9V6Q8_9ORYZ
MRRPSFLPVCALLVVMLCVASLMNVAEGRGSHRGGPRGIRGMRSSGSSRGLGGGTWAACAGSSLLAVAAMLF